jgi:hypothetical protein
MEQLPLSLAAVSFLSGSTVIGLKVHISLFIPLPFKKSQYFCRKWDKKN